MPLVNSNIIFRSYGFKLVFHVDSKIEDLVLWFQELVFSTRFEFLDLCSDITFFYNNGALYFIIKL